MADSTPTGKDPTAGGPDGPPDKPDPPGDSTGKKSTHPKSLAERIAPWLVGALGVILLVIGISIVLARTGVGPTTVTTSGTAPDTTVVTTPGKTALGSDVIDSFFLGTGAVLVLVGAFYPRISKIGLPGGASLEFLTPDIQSKMAGYVGQKLSDPAKIATAYTATSFALASQYRSTQVPPTDDDIQATVAAVTASLNQGSAT
jgi:hypothetical protein